jgi:N-acetylglucosamine-6-phosphate deacetylase
LSVLVSGRIARAGVLEDGWLEIEGERIAATGKDAPPRSPDVRHEGVVAPGLFDLQVNGAGGQEVTGGPMSLDAIDAIQLERGVTGYLATVVSRDDATAERCVTELAERVADPWSPMSGIHLEGPFLSPDHAGAHRPEALRSPADGVPGYFSSAAVRLVTIAPELPGAIELIRELHARGVTVALGHSGASTAVARSALDAGARLVTHLFNAMAPLHHRAPGLAGVALADARAYVGVIADGVHVDPLVLEIVRRAAGARVVLVSDATPAAAAPPGRYELGGVAIEGISDGAPRLADGRLAGSSSTLDVAVRNWASMTEATIAEALVAATEAPAAALGVGAGLHPGSPADVVLFDDHGNVGRVMRRGRWLS